MSKSSSSQAPLVDGIRPTTGAMPSKTRSLLYVENGTLILIGATTKNPALK